MCLKSKVTSPFAINCLLVTTEMVELKIVLCEKTMIANKVFIEEYQDNY